MPFVRQLAAVEVLETGADALESGNAGPSGDRRGVRQQKQQRMPRADMVLVFPYKVDARVRWGDASLEEATRGLRPALDWELHKMENWQAKRAMAVGALSDSGLVLMLYYSRDRDEIFVRVAADESHLRQVAEMRKYRLELKPQYLSAFAEYKKDYIGRRDLNYRDRCVVSHIYKSHIDSTDSSGGQHYPTPDAIFRTVDRIRLIDHIVRTTDHNCAAVDIGQLMHDGDRLHYFPLHEHRKLEDMDKDWFKCFAWGSHIDKVRDYFGERIAFYFLFMAHFNKWLLVPAVGGILLWLVDLMRGSPDNLSAVLLCLGMGIWCTLFAHYWRRSAATQALKWGTLGRAAGGEPEPTRPSFVGVSSVNPITGRVDRFYPWSQRIWKVLFSYSVLALALGLLLFLLMTLFALRHIFHEQAIMGRLTFMFLNAIAVELMNTLFTSLAKTLTERENHRAYSEFSTHLLAKTVVFKFVSCYSSLYYIAFFKQHSHLFGMPVDCVAGDCLNEVGYQVAVFLITRLTLQNFVEIGMPYVIMAYRNWAEGRQFHTSLFTNPLTVMPDLSTAEKQSKKEDYDLYEDMDEVLILYGYTTLFVTACPWLPLLALISSFLECFLDHKKLILLYRRPFPIAAANNEPWDSAFDIFGLIAMTTNAAIIVFTSTIFVEWSNAQKILLFLGIEHAMLFARLLVSIARPRVPHEVELLSLQQKVMVHRHLNLGGEEDDQESRANAMLTAPIKPPAIFDQDDDEDEW